MRTVTAPVSRSAVIRNKVSPPVVVSHSEYFDTLASPESLYKYEINPALGASFTWLSRVAQCYEKYRFRSLAFDFIPYVAATTAGTIRMAWDYDAVDAVPATVEIMSNLSSYVSGPLFQQVRLNVQTSLMHTNEWYYTRMDTVTGTDLKTYDTGAFIIAVDGESKAIAGDIRVSYTVELYSPNLEFQSTPPGEEDVWYDMPDAYNSDPVANKVFPWTVGHTFDVNGLRHYFEYLGMVSCIGTDALGHAFDADAGQFPVFQARRDCSGIARRRTSATSGNVTTPANAYRHTVPMTPLIGTAVTALAAQLFSGHAPSVTNYANDGAFYLDAADADFPYQVRAGDYFTWGGLPYLSNVGSAITTFLGILWAWSVSGHKYTYLGRSDSVWDMDKWRASCGLKSVERDRVMFDSRTPTCGSSKIIPSSSSSSSPCVEHR